jgi:uncharacterized protein with von Willebrand factor type A (vWA) domain
MSDNSGIQNARKAERIDVSWDYAVCAWARHFNASETQVKEAVAAVGDHAERVREHLAARRLQASERPSGGSRLRERASTP